MLQVLSFCSCRDSAAAPLALLVSPHHGGTGVPLLCSVPFLGGFSAQKIPLGCYTRREVPVFADTSRCGVFVSRQLAELRVAVSSVPCSVRQPGRAAPPRPRSRCLKVLLLSDLLLHLRKPWKMRRTSGLRGNLGGPRCSVWVCAGCPEPEDSALLEAPRSNPDVSCGMPVLRGL